MMHESKDMSETVAGKLAAFTVDRRYEDIPPLAIDYAAMLISSTVASAAMGYTLDSSRIVREREFERGGRAEASVWFGRAPMLPAAAAARINALMSDAAASDDSDLRNIVHPGTTLAATALAVAQKTGANGKAVLRAIALGYEAAGRINRGVVPGLIWEKGFHGCVIAIIGGAAAAGLLLGLDARQMTHALGLAATSIGGLVTAANTSTAREHHAGLAAMLGVEAAELARRGYQAEPGIYEHPKGFFAIYGIDAEASGRVASVTTGFGEQWEILGSMAIKLVPGGHPHHAIADAAAQAAHLGDVRPEDVTAIICARPNMRVLSGPRHPVDLIGVAHSPAYFAAAGVADRGFTWAHASPEKIMDPRIRRLLDLVEVGEPPTQDAEKYLQGATVTIKVRDGRSFTATLHAPRGSARIGIEWDDVETKYRTLCPLAGVSAPNMEQSMRTIRNFRAVSDVRELISLIA